MTRTPSLYLILILGTLFWGYQAARAEGYPNTSAFGGESYVNEDWYEECLAVEKSAPPTTDLPYGKDEVDALQECDPVQSYYDTLDAARSSSSEWRKVLHCAHLHHDTTVLSMLYANGTGAKRNLNLALRYACETPSSPIEMMNRVEHISNLNSAVAEANSDVRFDFCDDISTTLSIGFCVHIKEIRMDNARNAQLQLLTAHWSHTQQQVFMRLKQSLARFADARGSNETDMTHPTRAEDATEARAAEKQLFLEDIMHFEQGRLPTFTHQQFHDLDMQLNSIYQKVMRTQIKENAYGLGYTTITKDNVRTTQRIWLTYRDAFVAFGAARYPAVAAEAWMAMLTERRIDQLMSISVQE